MIYLYLHISEYLLCILSISQTLFAVDILILVSTTPAMAVIIDKIKLGCLRVNDGIKSSAHPDQRYSLLGSDTKKNQFCLFQSFARIPTDRLTNEC